MALHFIFSMGREEFQILSFLAFFYIYISVDTGHCIAHPCCLLTVCPFTIKQVVTYFAALAPAFARGMTHLSNARSSFNNKSFT